MMRSTDAARKDKAEVILVDPQLRNRYPLKYDYGYIKDTTGEIQGRDLEYYRNIRHEGTYELWWEQHGILTIKHVVIEDIQWWHDFTTPMTKFVLRVLPDAISA